MNDVLHADEIEFSVPRTPLTSGLSHSSIEENTKAVFVTLGLELITYQQVTRMVRGERVHFRLLSAKWLSRLRG